MPDYGLVAAEELGPTTPQLAPLYPSLPWAMPGVRIIKLAYEVGTDFIRHTLPAGLARPARASRATRPRPATPRPGGPAAAPLAPSPSTPTAPPSTPPPSTASTPSRPADDQPTAPGCPPPQPAFFASTRRN